MLGELLPVLVDLLENKKGKTLVSTSKSSLCVESIKIQSFEIVKSCEAALCVNHMLELGFELN